MIAFYDTEFEQAGQGYRQVAGYIYLLESANRYQKILIDNFGPEGGDPKIESVFFANADKDETKELIVICSWPQLQTPENIR
jgi:hypothetical protein